MRARAWAWFSGFSMAWAYIDFEFARGVIDRGLPVSGIDHLEGISLGWMIGGMLIFCFRRYLRLSRWLRARSGTAPEPSATTLSLPG